MAGLREAKVDQADKTDAPECFGVLQKVFPKGPSGLREVSPGCWDCLERVECLRLAVNRGEQAEVIREETAARSDGPGVAGFVKRWSRLKHKNRAKGAS